MHGQGVCAVHQDVKLMALEHHPNALDLPALYSAQLLLFSF
jgi:hypothetical protein